MAGGRHKHPSSDVRVRIGNSVFSAGPHTSVGHVGSFAAALERCERQGPDSCLRRR
jgi:hypothetical protein